VPTNALSPAHDPGFGRPAEADRGARTRSGRANAAELVVEDVDNRCATRQRLTVNRLLPCCSRTPSYVVRRALTSSGTCGRSITILEAQMRQLLREERALDAQLQVAVPKP
jgi:hypothetical protein